MPSTYMGRRFGKGIKGGALRGLGYIAKGTLRGGYAPIIIPPETIAQTAAASPEASQKLEAAESTGKPVSIGRQFYDLMKNVGSKSVELAKSGYEKFKTLSPTTKAMAAMAGLKGVEKALNTKTGKKLHGKA